MATSILTQVDRETAARINPAICDIGISGTCKNVSSTMTTLAFMMTTSECIPIDTHGTDVWRIQCMLAAALEFEVAQEEAKREAKGSTAATYQIAR